MGADTFNGSRQALVLVAQHDDDAFALCTKVFERKIALLRFWRTNAGANSLPTALASFIQKLNERMSLLHLRGNEK